MAWMPICRSRTSSVPSSIDLVEPPQFTCNASLSAVLLHIICHWLFVLRVFFIDRRPLWRLRRHEISLCGSWEKIKINWSFHTLAELVWFSHLLEEIEMWDGALKVWQCSLWTFCNALEMWRLNVSSFRRIGNIFGALPFNLASFTLILKVVIQTRTVCFRFGCHFYAEIAHTRYFRICFCINSFNLNPRSHFCPRFAPPFPTVVWSNPQANIPFYGLPHTPSPFCLSAWALW